MTDCYEIRPVGVVRKTNDVARIIIDDAYKKALLGLDGFSHIVVCYWFHKNDTESGRKRLQVHPRGDKKNPLTGVFATHSPVRPNLIAITRCLVESIEETTIAVAEIDALDGSPVIDIKCYIPEDRPEEHVRVPDWV